MRDPEAASQVAPATRQAPEDSMAGSQEESSGFADLEHGPTRYRLEGPAQGRPMLLVHGATVPHWQFDGLVPALNACGIRTLRFDLYGHGESARPRLRYGLELFVRQAEALLDHLAFPPDTAVLGHSMGAAVAAGLRARRSLGPVVLTAPLLDFRGVSRLPLLLRPPLFGPVLMRLLVLPALRRRRHRRFRAIGRPELAARFDEQLAYGGFGRALLSMMRGDALGPHGQRYAALGRCEPDVLVVWGAEDALIRADHLAQVLEGLPGHACAELAGREHNLLLVDPQTVTRIVKGFLEVAETGKRRAAGGRSVTRVTNAPGGA